MPPIGASETLQVTFYMTGFIFSDCCKQDIIKDDEAVATPYLLDMLWEAVPSDLLPRTERA